MMTAETLDRALRSFREGAWGDAYAQLARMDAHGGLGPEDLQRLAVAAHLTGHDAESEDAWTRAHQAFLEQQEPARAARCAFWLGLALSNRGQTARGGGWIGRARRVLEEAGSPDGPEAGYLLVPAALQQLATGDPGTAAALCADAIETGTRFGEPDLVAFGLLGRGQALIRMGDHDQGVGLLDQAMIAVETGEVSSLVAGIVYCAVILACQEIHDLDRAMQWTVALTDWCASHPDIVPYRGQCLVHRSELAQLRGDWSAAMDEVELACDRLSEPPGQPALGMACYQRAELCRLRGRFTEAEQAYAEASRWGHPPQPGLALLRLAQGRVDDAAGAIRRVLAETVDPNARTPVLAAAVEIELAAGDVDAARRAADELSSIAAGLDAPVLAALAAHAQGSVLLATGEPGAAVRSLQRARATWEQLQAPYGSARAGALIARACRELGDDDTARLELEAAQRVFGELGARPDLARLDGPPSRRQPGAAAGLTAREVEVVRLVAGGRTNREIAAELVISEKTVARHLSNIMTKLGLPNRAAATAYAYEHELL